MSGGGDGGPLAASCKWQSGRPVGSHAFPRAGMSVGAGVGRLVGVLALGLPVGASGFVVKIQDGSAGGIKGPRGSLAGESTWSNQFAPSGFWVGPHTGVRSQAVEEEILPRSIYYFCAPKV
jgi:hypothetical protein